MGIAHIYYRLNSCASTTAELSRASSQSQRLRQGAPAPVSELTDAAVEPQSTAPQPWGRATVQSELQQRAKYPETTNTREQTRRMNSCHTEAVHEPRKQGGPNKSRPLTQTTSRQTEGNQRSCCGSVHDPLSSGPHCEDARPPRRGGRSSAKDTKETRRRHSQVTQQLHRSPPVATLVHRKPTKGKGAKPKTRTKKRRQTCQRICTLSQATRRRQPDRKRNTTHS